MLANIEMRRSRYEKLSAVFLYLTVGFSAAFAVVVVVFAYILTNDNATGLPGATERLTASLDLATKESRSFAPDFKDSVAFREGLGPHLDRALAFQGDDTLKEAQSQLAEAIRTLRGGGSIEAFEPIVAKLRTDQLRGGPTSIKRAEFVNLLDRLQSSAGVFLQDRNTLPYRYSSVVQEARNASDLLKKHAESPEARSIDLWKRLGLGVVICTFFFVVLRFFASIYRENRTQALQAERDDLAVRQFYVAFKGAGEDVEGRRNVLSKLYYGERGSKSESDLPHTEGTEEAGMIKELIGALTKKL